MKGDRIMDQKRVVEQTENQGLASLVGLVNLIRQQKARERLSYLRHCKSSSFQELRQMEQSITQVIESNRGGAKGVHGFIGERAQVGISNARSLMDGNVPQYRLIDDNGMTDYFRGKLPIQQKACISDKTLGLTHVKAHCNNYPEYISEQNGIYQIPRDFYVTYKRFKDMPASEAGKLLKADWRLWKRVQAFQEECPDCVIEPMVVDYADIQANAIGQTIGRERLALERVYRKRRAVAVKKGKASLREGARIVACSAAIEGLVDGGLSVIEHLQEGKSFSELDRDDWCEIGVDALQGVSKGAVRGGAVYAMTNLAGIPAPIAGASVSVAFVTIEATAKYVNGDLDGVECAETIAEGCLNAAVCAAFAKLGDRIIKVPILGSLVGGAVGMLACELIKFFVMRPKPQAA